MALVRLRNITVSFGSFPVIEDIDFAIDQGERVSLVGRNGTGKSTLLKVISGEVQAETGSIECGQSIKISKLAQEADIQHEGTIFDVVSLGLGEIAKLLSDYHHVSHKVGESSDEKYLRELERLQHDIEQADAWQFNQKVDSVLSKMQLDPELLFESLSGGMKRRVLLAQALVNDPDLLLLDEPTNHIDLETIQWLEDMMMSFKGAILFITHDRSFMTRLATRIVELDRGQLTSYPGDYETFLRRRAENLKAEAEANQKFDKKLAQEEVWIRQGIKARRTRNEGRVRALEALREERKQRRAVTGKATINVAEQERSGKLIAELTDVSFKYEGKTIVSGLTTTILRGDKVAIIGPNGAGKTTLLKLILGDLKPEQGQIKLGTKQQVAYFDQLRDKLELDKSVIDNVSQGRERIEINGQQKHVIGYLQEFLFTPDRVRSPVSALSGGERNRLLLAQLFSKPANILVMDEPTNDLDIETLELLEELLIDFEGTVLLVSHDRAFVNNIATSTLVFEDGSVNEYVGGYDDWLHQSAQNEKPVEQASVKSPDQSQSSAVNNTSAKKLSYKDQRELDALPAKIESLENSLEELHSVMSSPEFFKKEKNEIIETQQKLAQFEHDLEVSYQRWELLEQRKS